MIKWGGSWVRGLSMAACVLSCSLGSQTALASSDVFSVTNSTDSRIVKLLMSENRKQWGYFDIGKGIPPGKTLKLRWGKNTGNQACEQYAKAVFADGSESRPVKFDFCEEDLELEFNED